MAQQRSEAYALWSTHLNCTRTAVEVVVSDSSAPFHFTSRNLTIKCNEIAAITSQSNDNGWIDEWMLPKSQLHSIVFTILRLDIKVTNWLQHRRMCHMITTPFNCTPISSCSIKLKSYVNHHFHFFFSVKWTDWPFESSIKIELLQNFQFVMLR